MTTFITCHCQIPWKRRPHAFCLFFVYSPYLNLAFTIAPIKLHWSNLRQINKPANKKLFKVSVININFLDFLWKCFDSLNMYSLSCLTPCFNRANDRGKLDHRGERKPYCTSISMVWWHIWHYASLTNKWIIFPTQS